MIPRSAGLMGNDSGIENAVLIRTIRTRVAIVVFGILALFLFSSEFTNTFFNNQLDAIGATPVERIRYVFKPTVVALFVVFSSVLFTMIMRYLKPLIRYLSDGAEYQKARSAAINVPWIIIVFQLVAWTVGTTLYYMIHGWSAESGIPYPFGLLLKIGVGFPAAIYTSIMFNLLLIPAKEKLNITDIQTRENDRFSRQRDYYAIVAAVAFLIINYSYIVYYYTRARVEVSFSGLYMPLILLSVFYGAISIGMILLSKKEYFAQIQSVETVLRNMAEGRTRTDQRIQITNFNEIGEVSAHVNAILDSFSELLREINSIASLLAGSSQRLADAGQQNAAYSNQQASSASEIVSTMEGVNSLSADIGRRVREVEQMAVRSKESVLDGFRITKDNIAKMKEVTESYAETISGMKNLGEHIAGIWEIVKIINGIAGQIKIIAFNAALEASSAGEAGKNFEIVAGEIRRLADSTVASTNEIRSKIGDIQQASDMLIGSSEVDTLKIQDAWQMSNQLESVFENILSTSEETSTASGEMSNAVEQQINAFEQILMTSRQISEGIHAFTGSIEESSTTARTLEETVESLNRIVAGRSETREQAEQEADK
jgi:methyl-accepting chemotaxis protein